MVEKVPRMRHRQKKSVREIARITSLMPSSHGRGNPAGLGTGTAAQKAATLVQ